MAWAGGNGGRRTKLVVKNSISFLRKRAGGRTAKNKYDPKFNHFLNRFLKIERGHADGNNEVRSNQISYSYIFLFFDGVPDLVS